MHAWNNLEKEAQKASKNKPVLASEREARWISEKRENMQWQIDEATNEKHENLEPI